MIAGRSALLFAAAVALSSLSCSSEDAPSKAAAPSATDLPSGVVARVGSADIHGISVARIAAAQGLDLERARDVAVRDALFANEAVDRKLDQDPSVRASLETALARLLLRDLLAEAKRRGPVTDDELHDATQFYWLEMDRPPGFRTVHAVVRLDAKTKAPRQKEALAIAESIRRALEPVAAGAASTSPPAQPSPSSATPDAPPQPPSVDPIVEPFKQAANAVPHEGFQLIVEPLPAVAADGRVLEPGGSAFDPDFARAASSLERRGDLSAPVVSPFGVHVIMLLERTPPLIVPVEERRSRLYNEVVLARARRAQHDILDRTRDASAIDRSADALLALVPVGR